MSALQSLLLLVCKQRRNNFNNGEQFSSANASLFAHFTSIQPRKLNRFKFSNPRSVCLYSRLWVSAASDRTRTLCYCLHLVYAYDVLCCCAEFGSRARRSGTGAKLTFASLATPGTFLFYTPQPGIHFVSIIYLQHVIAASYRKTRRILTSSERSLRA
jgi:hypothetical protein